MSDAAPWLDYQQGAGGGPGASGPDPNANVGAQPGGGTGAPPAAGGDEAPWLAYQRSSAPVASEEPHPVLHQIGLAARAAATGVASVPGIVSDAITGPINAGLDAVLGEGKGFRFQRIEAAVSSILNGAGVPQPQNKAERIVQDVTAGMAAGAGFVGISKAVAAKTAGVVQSFAQQMAEGPALQVASGGTSGAASGTAREEGVGPVGQAAAGLAGALAPTGAAVGFEAGIRGLMRGGSVGREAAAERLANFEGAGTTPTVGQVTDSRVARATESLLARAPGGAGVIAAKAQSQADDMAGAVQALSDSLAPNASSASAGEAIIRGVQAFKSGFKETQGALYDRLDAYIPSETPVAVGNTRAALAALNEDIANAPELSKWFKNGRIQGIEAALKSDVGEALPSPLQDALRRNPLYDATGQPVRTPPPPDGTLPFEAVKKLRTLVGTEIADSGLAADVPRSKWTSLYGAITQDLRTAAEDAGPDAMQAWSRANAYTRLHMDRLEQLSSVVSQQTPERVFQAALAGTSEGNTQIRRVMQALPVEDRRQVAAGVLQRMGRATPGQQNAEGDAFSSERFLTSLSKMSLPARQTIFGSTSVKGILDRVGQLAKVAESRREGGKVFANPSGTTGAAVQMAHAGAIGGGAVLAATGHPATLAGALAGTATAYGAARMLTSPSMARRAATATSLPPGAAPTAIAAAARAATMVPQHRGPDPQHLADVLNAGSVEEAATAAMKLATGGGHGADLRGISSLVHANAPYRAERLPTGSLNVRGDQDLIREALANLPPDVTIPTSDGIQIAPHFGDRAASLLKDFDPHAYASLNGKKVAIEVQAEDGTRATLKLDAGRALRATDARERQLEQLRECVGRST